MAAGQESGAAAVLRPMARAEQSDLGAWGLLSPERVTHGTSLFSQVLGIIMMALWSWAPPISPGYWMLPFGEGG